MATLLPERPISLAIEGTLNEQGGATYDVRGRLLLQEDNDLIIEGDARLTSAGKFGAPTIGVFEGRLQDGSEISIPDCAVDNMNIRWGQLAAGWAVRLVALGSVDWVREQASYSGDQQVLLRCQWTLTHSPLLWNAAKRFYNYNFEKLQAVGLREDLERALHVPRPSPCAWSFNGFELEVGYFEQKRVVPDAITNYPVSGSKFVPRVMASLAGEALSAAEVTNRIERAQGVVDALLACVAFLEGAAVHWYERHELVETSDTDAKGRRGLLHGAVRLRLGQFPSGLGQDARRAHLLGGLVAERAPDLVRGFLDGAPFTEAALDTYLLARRTPHSSAKLLLLSTALESLKELYLRESPQRGILSVEHWRQVCDGLKGHLKKGLWKPEYGPKELRGQIYGKMADLNRPSYRRTLESMVDAWGVSLDGLAEPYGFITVRDAVVHTGQLPNDDFERLAAATTTLQALFERLMAARLGLDPGVSGLGVP